MKKLLLNFLLATIFFVNANAQTQPNNSGFENWNSLSGGGENPVGWSSTNDYISLGYPELLFKTTDANAGTYALKVKSDTATLNAPLGTGILDTVMGMAFLGPMNMNNPGIPYTETPDILTFFVKGTVMPGNSCYVMAKLTRWDSINGKRDEIATAVYMMPSSNPYYKEQKIWFNYYLSYTPDSLNISISAGDPASGVILPGNEIFVDDVSLGYAASNNVSFTYDTSNVCAPVTINFTNTSNVFGAAYYEWRFNDGSNTVTAFDTSHIFTKGGNFWVELTAYDSMYNYLGSYGNDVYLMGGDLHVTATQACAGDEIYFGYSGDVDDKSMVWNFGDGTTFNGWDAKHIYSGSGNYNVSLIVNDKNCGWDTLTETITIGTFTPTANFDSWPNPVCPNDNLTFESKGSAGTFVWIYGDGKSDTTSNPRMQHQYSTTGNYNVTMKVTNACGLTDTYSDFVNVQNNVPINEWIQFYLSPDSACKGDNIHFEVWDDTYNKFAWNFGDGTTDSTRRSTHAYSSTGNYSASLTVTNGCGNDTTLYQTVYIGTNVPASSETYEYGIIPDMACPGDSIIFYSDNAPFVKWDFGDGTIDTMPQAMFEGFVTTHAYSDTGTYDVIITLTNGCGNSMTDTTEVVIGDTMKLSSPFGTEYIHWDGRDGGSGISSVQVCESTYFVILTSGNSFKWNFGDGTVINTNSLTVNHAYTSIGDYTISVIVKNGCGDSATFTDKIRVEGVCNKLFTTITGNNPKCNSINDGSVTVNATGGKSPYMYSWSNGATSPTINNLSAGTYTVTVKDANNDTSIASIVLTAPSAISLTTTSTNTSCGNSDGTATVTATGGTSSFTYKWSDNKTQTTATATGLSAGNYTVTVTDANGCSGNTSVTVNGSGSISASVTTTKETCGSSNGTAKVTATGGVSPYTYLWSNGQTNSTATGLKANSYSVTVTDSMACKAIQSATVTNTTGPSVSVTGTDANCSSSSDGNASVVANGGTNPYTYLWSNGKTSTIITGLSTGIYKVTVTDSIGCTATATQIIGVSGSIIKATATSTDASCRGNMDGLAAVVAIGGKIPYSYSWSNGKTTKIITGLSAGNYSVTITDASGCTATDGVTISEQTSTLSISVSTVAASCGKKDGSATATVSGGTSPYTYSWTSGKTTATSDSLKSGIYIVTVTDKEGCSEFAIATISDAAGATVTVDSTKDVNCYGSSSGKVYVSVSGGTTPYTYSWSNGSTTKDVTNLKAGPYEVSVTDAKACISTKGITINEASALKLTATTTAASCDSSDGTATVNISGGTTPFTYLWSDGKTVSAASGLSAGAYKLTVTDKMGCKDSITASISEVGATTISIDLITDASCGNTGGSVFISASDTGVSYEWSDGSSAKDLIGVPAGTYDVTVTNSGGCKATESVTIQPKTPAIPNICIVTVDSATRSNQIVWEKVPGEGIASYNIYKESTRSNVYYLVDNIPYDNLSTFIDSGSNPLIRSWRYRLTTVDSCGNESKFSNVHKTVHLTINKGISNNINLIWDHYQGFTFSSYYIYRFSLTKGWEKIDSLPNDLTSFTDYTPPAKTVFYMIEVIKDSGCNPLAKVKNYNTSRSNTSSITDVSDVMLADVSYTDITNNCNGTATVIMYGGKSPYTYQWSDTKNQTSETATGLCEGTYQVTVTDFNGDTTSTSVTLIAVEINDISWLENIKIYPNPSDGNFELEILNYKSGIKNAEIRIYNVLGEKVYHQTLNTKQKTLNLSFLPDGMYNLQLISEEGVVNRKIIVNY